MKTDAVLKQIHNEHPIRKSTDAEFLFLIQRAALLGLKDAGILNEVQHRHAEEMLTQQHRAAVRACLAGEKLHD